MKLLHGDRWAPYVEKSIRDAQDALRISCFLFSPHWRRIGPRGVNILQACIDAAQRGLDCRAVLAHVPQRGSNIVPNIKTAEILYDAGWHIRWIGPNVMLHEKIIIIDRLQVIIGSHNLSNAAAAKNLECSIALDDPQIAQETRQLWWNRWYRAIDSAPDIQQVRSHGLVQPTVNPALTGGAVLAAARRKKGARERALQRRAQSDRAKG